MAGKSPESVENSEAHREITILLLSTLLTLPFLLLSLACGLEVFHRYHHRPDLAARSAEEFARAAFVERNEEKAMQFYWNEDGNRITRADLSALVRKMHPDGFPSDVKATDYEPVVGQPAMTIYLRGSNGKEEFIYRLLLQGTSDTGYKVSDFFRGLGPYPASAYRKPL